jgi:hypothetical protein
MLNHSLRLARSAQTASALLGALAIGACGSSQSAPSAPSSPSSPSSSTTGAHGGTSSHAAPASPQPVPSPCARARLRLTFVATQGATGHLEVTFALRNTSATMCTMRGYPGARLLDVAGHTIATRLKRGGGFFPDTMNPPGRVMLAPSASARFGLSFVTNSEYAGARRCVRATALESVPPGGGGGALRVSLTGGRVPLIAPCGKRLVTSPVYAG